MKSLQVPIHYYEYSAGTTAIKQECRWAVKVSIAFKGFEV